MHMRAVLVGLIVALAAPASADDWATYYEKSGYQRTPDYQTTVAYCKRLADASPWVRYTTFGTSPQGRDLSLLIVDHRGRFSAEEIRRSDNAVVLIQAGIHAGEIDGKDAGLMLIRDIAIHKEFQSLIDNVTILFMPIFNVDGHERSGPHNRANQNGPEEMGWRVTANNLNLNRDYVKADAPEMRAWLRLYAEWLPEFLVDCHVTDGADYQYVVTYAVENMGSMDSVLTQWVNDRFLPPLNRAMDTSGFPIIRYNWYRVRREPKSGIIAWASPPKLSTGYAAVQNRPALLIETHMLKDYRTRVTGTYEMLRHTLEILNEEHATVRRLVSEADERTASPQFREAPFPLSFQMNGDSVMIDFKGYEYEVVDSDVTGGKWYRYSNRPAVFRIPLFNGLEPVASAALPEAYVVPAEWTEVIERLSLHGIAMKRLPREWTVPVTAWRMTNPEWSQSPNEGRFPVRFDVNEFTEKRTFPAGSVVIDMNQRAARVVAHALDPSGPNSFVREGFFNAVFEQKEYIESYILEELARSMLERDESLRSEFEEKKVSDPDFAASPGRIRRWFYERTPYWDQRMGVYPVAKITDRSLLDQMPR
jgi:hypothetical protein